MYDDYPRDYRQDYTRSLSDGPGGSRVDAKRLWAGGAATALVAALTAFIGLMVARGIFGIPVLAPTEAGLVGDVTTVGLCSLAAAGALVGAALMHLLLLTTPSPQTFFAVIAGLVTVVFVLQPFTTDSAVTTKIATALVYLVTGGVIGFLITTVASNAER